MDPELRSLLTDFGLTGEPEGDLVALGSLPLDRLAELEAALTEEFDALRSAEDVASIDVMRDILAGVEAIHAEREARPERVRVEGDALAHTLAHTLGRPERETPSLAAAAEHRPRSAAPRVRRVPRAVTAAGQPLETLDDVAAAMVDKLAELERTGRPGSVERFRVARITVPYPAERRLDPQDVTSNDRAIESVVAGADRPERWPDAIVASGGFCAPLEPLYDVEVWSEPHRPVRDSMPRFAAERGGVRHSPAPVLSSIATGGPAAAGTNQAITVWDNTTDITPGSNRKVFQTITCPAVTDVTLQAIVNNLQVGNLAARAFPERVAAVVRLAIAAHARIAEQELLDAMSAVSTAVTTSVPVTGAARDLLHVIDQAAAAMRSRHRMLPDARLRVWLPEWVPAMFRADVVNQHAGDGLDAFAVTEGTVRSWLSARNVNASFYSDERTGAGQIFGAQGPTDLRNWSTVVEWYITQEGGFVFLDGGTLDLGVVRDSTLNATNDQQIFSESFEALAFRGVEALRVRSTVCPHGAGALDVDNSAMCAGS